MCACVCLLRTHTMLFNYTCFRSDADLPLGAAFRIFARETCSARRRAQGCTRIRRPALFGLFPINWPCQPHGVKCGAGEPSARAAPTAPRQIFFSFRRWYFPRRRRRPRAESDVTGRRVGRSFLKALALPSARPWTLAADNGRVGDQGAEKRQRQQQQQQEQEGKEGEGYC